jgi:hypothetical protein
VSLELVVERGIRLQRHDWREAQSNIAAMWQQGSSDRLKLDSGWDVKRRLQSCTGRSAQGKVKAWAVGGLRWR